MSQSTAIAETNAQIAERIAKHVSTEGRCLTCGQLPSRPYRRVAHSGIVIEGCIAPAHVGHVADKWMTRSAVQKFISDQFRKAQTDAAEWLAKYGN